VPTEVRCCLRGVDATTGISTVIALALTLHADPVRREEQGLCRTGTSLILILLTATARSGPSFYARRASSATQPIPSSSSFALGGMPVATFHPAMP
jgi:hypothetical protein